MKKIIFLDRDGVINKDPGGWTKHGYVTEWKDFVFLPDSIRAIKRLNQAGYDVVIISNQAGVSKGCYTKEKLDEINKNMLREIKDAGGDIKKVYYCIHQDSDNCNCRKPKTGMFKQAQKEMGIKIGGSYFIGDGKMDVEAARNVGLKSILLLSGKTALGDIRTWRVKPDYIFDDLNEAVDFILKNA